MSRNHPAHEDPKRWRRLRARLFDAANWRCAVCGGLCRELDHIKPVEQDGARWERANLQQLCKKCHFSKSAKEREARRGPPTAWQKLVKARMQDAPK